MGLVRSFFYTYFLVTLGIGVRLLVLQYIYKGSIFNFSFVDLSSFSVLKQAKRYIQLGKKCTTALKPAMGGESLNVLHLV